MSNKIKVKAKDIIIRELSLVPKEILLLLWTVSLVTPNLVYSGSRFADTLHIMKWTVTAAPVLIALLIAGLAMFFYKPDKFKSLEPKFDLFALV
ncbi:MAG: hypothetical protein IJ576_02740, partial [Synergistaceae bacterium]|nr:hypothetical protein [Synergistaceae bacterium]